MIWFMSLSKALWFRSSQKWRSHIGSSSLFWCKEQVIEFPFINQDISTKNLTFDLFAPLPSAFGPNIGCPSGVLF